MISTFIYDPFHLLKPMLFFLIMLPWSQHSSGAAASCLVLCIAIAPAILMQLRCGALLVFANLSYRPTSTSTRTTLWWLVTWNCMSMYGFTLTRTLWLSFRFACHAVDLKAASAVFRLILNSCYDSFIWSKKEHKNQGGQLSTITYECILKILRPQMKCCSFLLWGSRKAQSAFQ